MSDRILTIGEANTAILEEYQVQVFVIKARQALGNSKLTRSTPLPGTYEEYVEAVAEVIPELKQVISKPGELPHDSLGSDEDPPDDEFAEDESPLRTAGEVADLLHVTVDEVLGLARVEGGNIQTLVNVETVKIQKELADSGVIDTEEPTTGAVLLSDTTVRRMFMTSDRRTTTRADRQSVSEFLTVLKEWWRVFLGPPFRPTPESLIRTYEHKQTKERVRMSDGLPPEGAANDWVLKMVSYPNPILPGRDITLYPRAFNKYVANVSEPFPVVDPNTLRFFLNSLSSLTIVHDQCDVCGQYLDQLLNDKLMKLLTAEYYLPRTRRETAETLMSLGYSEEDLTKQPRRVLRGELKFKVNHWECNLLIEGVGEIMAEMYGQDFDDEKVVAVFIGRAKEMVNRVALDILQLSDKKRVPRYLFSESSGKPERKDLSKKLAARVAGIVKVLLGDDQVEQNTSDQGVL